MWAGYDTGFTASQTALPRDCDGLAAAVPSCGFGVSPGGYPRRIAPELFPEYRGSLTEAQPNRRVPDSEHPRGSCEAASVPRSQWLRCLRETGALLDEKIEKTVAAIAEEIGGRAGINPARARHWRTAIGKAHEKWRDFRDYDGYEAQLLCRLRTGQERLSDLARRYPPP